MNNWADRERALADALHRIRPAYSWARCLYEARGFIAMRDADRAFDAAQEPKATTQPEPSVVETVREAMGRLIKDSNYINSARWQGDRYCFVGESLWAGDAALATILNNVPALLAEAKRGNEDWLLLSKEIEALRADLETERREGVIKGLERAAQHIDATADLSTPHERTIKFRAQWCREEAARIRSGGEIEPSVDPTSTGVAREFDEPATSDAERALQEMREKLAELHNTHRHKFSAAVEAATDELFKACSQMNTGLRASFRSDNNAYRKAVADCNRMTDDGETQPAPQELPKGWVELASWSPTDTRSVVLAPREYNGVLTMARAALTLREALCWYADGGNHIGMPSKHEDDRGRRAKAALASLEKPNG